MPPCWPAQIVQRLRQWGRIEHIIAECRNISWYCCSSFFLGGVFYQQAQPLVLKWFHAAGEANSVIQKCTQN